MRGVQASENGIAEGGCASKAADLQIAVALLAIVQAAAQSLTAIYSELVYTGVVKKRVGAPVS